jgi:hypothetical protein
LLQTEAGLRARLDARTKVVNRPLLPQLAEGLPRRGKIELRLRPAVQLQQIKRVDTEPLA